MRSDLVLVLLLAALATVRPGPTTFVNGTDYPLDLRTSPAPDTTWTHVSAGARASAWQQLPETLFINRDSISADPLMYLFASVPARAKAAGFVLMCGTNLCFIQSYTPPLPIGMPERDCFRRSVFHLSPLDWDRHWRLSNTRLKLPAPAAMSPQ